MNNGEEETSTTLITDREWGNTEMNKLTGQCISLPLMDAYLTLITSTVVRPKDIGNS